MYYTSILFFHIKVYSIVYRPNKWVVGLMLIWEKDVHKMHLLISLQEDKSILCIVYICKFLLIACEFYMVVKFTQFEAWYTYLIHDRFKDTTTWTDGEGLFNISCFFFFFNLFLSPHGKCHQDWSLLFSQFDLI